MKHAKFLNFLDERRAIGAAAIVITVLFVAFIVFSYYYNPLLNENKHTHLDNFNSGWVDDEGKNVHIPDFYDTPEGEICAISNTLPLEFNGEYSIYFHSTFATVKVFLDGKLIYNYDGPENSIFLRGTPSSENIIDIPSNSAGHKIRIEQSSQYKSHSVDYNTISIAPTSTIYEGIMNEGVFRFLSGAIVIGIGLAMAIVYIVKALKNVGSSALIWFSVFLITIGFFAISNDTVFRFLLGDNTTCALMSRYCLLFAPIPYTMYLKSKFKGRLLNIMRWLSLFQMTLFLAISMVVSFTKVDTVDVTPVINTVFMLMVFLCVFFSFFKEGSRYVSLFFFVFISASAIHFFCTANVDWSAYLVCLVYYIYECNSITDMDLARAMETRLAKEGEQKAVDSVMVTQITNHFIFHVMNDVRVLIKMDPDRAYDSMGDFAKYLRYKTDSMADDVNFVTFGQELKSIKAYCNLQKMLHPNIKVEYNVENDEYLIPVLSIQPAVENAIEHGLKPQGSGTVTISSRVVDDRFEVEIKDDGVGFDINKLSNDGDHISVSGANVAKRIASYGNGNSVITSTPGQGTTVLFTFNKMIKEDKLPVDPKLERELKKALEEMTNNK